VTEIFATELQISRLFPEANGSLPILPTPEDIDPTDLFSEAQLWPEDDAEGFTPVEGYYRISRSYWNDGYDADDIDWKTSTISIHRKYIKFGETSGLKNQAEYNDVIRAPLFIFQPDLLLSKIPNIPPLPTAMLVERYKGVRRHFWTEITAATWRLLAFEDPANDQLGLQTKLIKELRDYMLVHGLLQDGDAAGPADSTMRAVVQKILQQRRDRNTRDSVLASSTANIVPTGRRKS
jgi:hypothetical protein